MEEEQVYRLMRSKFISAIMVLPIALILLGINLDILFWESPLVAWITYENYTPIITTLVALSLPFWALGIFAEIKLKDNEEA